MLNFSAAQTNIDETAVLKSKEETTLHIAANKGDLIEIAIKRTEGKKISQFYLTALKDDKRILNEENFKRFKGDVTSSERSVYELNFKNETTQPIAFSILVKINSFGERVC